MPAYQNIICCKKGNYHNDINIIRTALRQGIPNPKELSVQQMEESAKHVNTRKQALRDTGSRLRRGPSSIMSNKSRGEQEYIKVNSEKATIDCEDQKKMWYFINISQKDPYWAAGPTNGG